MRQARKIYEVQEEGFFFPRAVWEHAWSLNACGTGQNPADAMIEFI